MSGPDDVHGRFRVPPGSLQPGSVRVGADQARHMQVRRLGPGARVMLFDGEGAEAVARIESLDADGAVATVDTVEAASGESGLELVLVQALPVKLPRLDDVVRQATELGVSRIVPVLAERSRLPGGGRAAIDRRAERWRRIAETAAKQSGRGRVPPVESPERLDAVDPGGWPRTRLLMEPEARAGLPVDLDGAAGVTLLVGPEGGWTASERALLEEWGCRGVSLGPRILRADSAGPAALAVVQFLAGDLS